MSNAPVPEIKTLPAFMRSESPGVKFDSPFPPLNPRVKVRGVMERAGFDVYKPSQRVHSSYHLKSSNASSPIVSTRNFTAPVPHANSKTMSDPNFGARSWKESNVESLTPRIQQKNVVSEEQHSPSSSESEPLRIPKTRQEENPYASMEFASANSSNTTVTGADLKEEAESFDFGARRRAATATSNNGLYAPKSLAAPIPIDVNSEDDSDEDYVNQLLSMKKQLEPKEVPNIVVQNEAGVAKPRVFSGDFNVYSPPAPTTFTRFHRDSGMSTTSSVYTMDAGQRVTSVGTMNTNDTKIYNLEVKKEPEADMSAIQEVTEEDLEDSQKADIIERLDEMRLDSHSTLDQPFEDAAESFPRAATPSVRTESSFQQTTSDSTLYERNFLAMAGKQHQPTSSLSSFSTTTAPQLFAAGEGPCRKCGLPVEGKSIWSKDSQLSGQWHRRCFGCYTCDKPFPKGTSCYVFKDSPYCEQHFHEINGSICQSCSKGIEGQCLETENGSKFHPGCLVCSVCKTGIKEDYYLLGTEIICEQDAMEMRYSGASPTTTSKLERRRTKTIRV